jgi:AAA family ATPase
MGGSLEFGVRSQLTSVGRAEVVFAGMTFKNVTLRGPKRTFIVDFVNGNPTGLATFDESSSLVNISSRLDSEQQVKSVEPLVKLELVDIAGIDQALRSLNEFLAEFDLKFRYQWAQRSCAALLHGGHGTGKTFIMEKVITTGWAKYVMRIDSDAKPETIRTVFKNAKLSQPSIIVIDDLEELVGKEDTISRKISKVLEEELDTLSKSHSGTSLPRVLVIAATLDISSIPISLRKVGRFWTDIALPIPDAAARKAILRSIAPPLHPESRDAILDRLGDRTHAYTAEDLVSLLTRACVIAERKINSIKVDDANAEYYLSQDDLEQALLRVRPTAMHDVTLQPPSIKWNDIGGQDGIKKALRLAVETPLIVSTFLSRRL